MRIGIDARMFHKAGIRRYSSELIQNLSLLDRRNEYTVYLSSNAHPDEIKDLTPNFKHVYLEAPLFSLKEHLLLISHLRKDRLDVFHTTFDFGVPLWPVRNVIVTVHDVFFGPGTFFRNYKTRLMYQVLTKYSVRRSEMTIVISNFIKKKLLEYMPQRSEKLDRIRVVYNGVGTEFSPVREPGEAEWIKQKYGIRDRYILCVGSFASGIKNLSRILKAFSVLPSDLRNNYQLVIAGEIFQRVPEAEDMIKELKDRRRILCLGYVPDLELPSIYRNAEVFMFPSLHEGFGIPVLEAMACGTPVVTSNITGIPEVAGDAALLIDPYSTDEIREGMSKMLTDVHLRNDKSEKGLQRAQEFSWGLTAKKTLGIYEELDKRK
jgi:glycosyltransferase involved in cell wall biosynthesis